MAISKKITPTKRGLDIGTLVTQARSRMGISQAAFAQTAGMNQPTLWRIESGKTRHP